MAEISKAGIPDKNTVGRLGDIRTNTVTGDRYKLAYISKTTTYDGTYMDYEWEFINDGFISSNIIKKVDIVTELPEVEENGVLYVVSDGAITSIVKINGAIVYDRYESLLIVRYTASESGLTPTFNNDFKGYEVKEEDNGDGSYTISVLTNSVDNLPTIISFNAKTNLLTVEKFSIKNTSNVNNMSFMFNNCRNLTSLDLSGFDTSKVTTMQNMFYGCNNLTSLDVSGFDTSKVTSMPNMFSGCNNLTSLDLSGFNTSNVTNMASMFNNCRNLTSINLSGFDTSEVTDMEYMFNGCTKLQSLDLSGLNISKVTSMKGVFGWCEKLTSLDLSEFDTSRVTDMSSMFTGCINLTSLKSMKNISTDLTLPSQLNQESTLDVVDNLAVVTETKTLKMSNTQLSQLSSDKIKEANNKGWTITA